MAIIHDKYVIELKEVIKGYGNDPQEKDPFRFPCDYKFYEIDGVAICEESFKKMKLLEDIAIPKADYETRLKADMVAMLTEIQLECEENTVRWYVGRVDGKSDDVVLMETLNEIIQQKINALKGDSDGA